MTLYALAAVTPPSILIHEFPLVFYLSFDLLFQFQTLSLTRSVFEGVCRELSWASNCAFTKVWSPVVRNLLVTIELRIHSIAFFLWGGHSLCESCTTHSCNSEGLCYVPNSLLWGIVDRYRAHYSQAVEWSWAEWGEVVEQVERGGDTRQWRWYIYSKHGGKMEDLVCVGRRSTG